MPWKSASFFPNCERSLTYSVAACSVAKAGRLYGSDSAEAKAVKDSWHGVGIDVD